MKILKLSVPLIYFLSIGFNEQIKSCATHLLGSRQRQGYPFLSNKETKQIKKLTRLPIHCYIFLSSSNNNETEEIRKLTRILIHCYVHVGTTQTQTVQPVQPKVMPRKFILKWKCDKTKLYLPLAIFNNPNPIPQVNTTAIVQPIYWDQGKGNDKQRLFLRNNKT